MDDEAGGRHRVVHRHRRDPCVAHALLRLLHERAVLHDRRLGRDLREVRPRHVVEDTDPKRIHDGLEARHRERRARLGEGECLGEEGEARDVVEMRMRDERVLDLRLLGQGERATDRAGIDQDAVVDEEGRGALTESFGSVGAEHSNLHSRPILA